MLTLPVMGCDPHLDTITTAVISPEGVEVATATVANTETGWRTCVGTCRRLGIEQVGIEGASGYGRRLAQTLNQAGIEVLEIPTRVTARTRRIDGAGKTDPGDARTIARAVPRKDGHRWVDDPNLETLRVLTARRQHLVTAQTADINQLRALLAEINPQTAAGLARLRSTRAFTALTQLETSGDQHRQTVTELIRQIARECNQRLEQIRSLTHRIGQVMPPVGHQLITHIQGCGTIVAAQLLSQLAGIDQHATPAKLAAWAGVAPLDASSGRQQRHRLNRGGNRQANRALHTIILTQLRQKGEAHTYITRRLAEIFHEVPGWAGEDAGG